MYHYDVEISSVRNFVQEGIPTQKKARCASTVINRMVIAKLAHVHRKDLGNCLPAYDGRKNMYLRRKLNIGGKASTARNLWRSPAVVLTSIPRL